MIKPPAAPAPSSDAADSRCTDALCQQVFQLHDEQDSGVILLEELAAVLTVMKMTSTQDETLHWIKQADIDDNDAIELDEFSMSLAALHLATQLPAAPGPNPSQIPQVTLNWATVRLLCRRLGAEDKALILTLHRRLQETDPCHLATWILQTQHHALARRGMEATTTPTTAQRHHFITQLTVAAFNAAPSEQLTPPSPDLSAGLEPHQRDRNTLAHRPGQLPAEAQEGIHLQDSGRALPRDMAKDMAWDMAMEGSETVQRAQLLKTSSFDADSPKRQGSPPVQTLSFDRAQCQTTAAVVHAALAEEEQVSGKQLMAARIAALCDQHTDDLTTLYDLGKELGSGRFSVVMAGVHRESKDRVALKVVEKKSLEDEEDLAALETEIQILRKLGHPSVVRMKEVVATTDNIYIVMELLTGGELFTRIVTHGPYTEAAAVPLFATIVLAIDYLHDQDIVHRDLKPENIVFQENPWDPIDVKLIDFGYAGIWTPQKELTGLCGTPAYVAPEVLTWYGDDGTGANRGKPYGKGSDLWTLGVLLYVILAGRLPFDAEDEDELLAQVCKAQYEFTDGWRHISSKAKDVISNLLIVEPEKRMSLLELKQHPWVKDAIIKKQKQLMLKQQGIQSPMHLEPPLQQHTQIVNDQKLPQITMDIDAAYDMVVNSQKPPKKPNACCAIC